MSKRIESQFKQFKRSREKIRFNLGTISLTVFCAFLVVIATFSQLSFSHYIIPTDAIFHPFKFFENPENHFIQLKYCEYIPQIPTIFFISTLLGSVFASIAVAIYIILGLAYLPIFAMGGGISYITQYNFGYILAYLPAIIVICRTLKNGFSYKAAAKAALYGILIIHITGILYTIVIALLKGEAYDFILDWIATQSTAKMLYDFIFSFLAIVFAKILKKLLWVIMG